MGTFLFFLSLYVFSLASTVKAARTGKSLFFPNFRKIDEVYFLGRKKVWNTWSGKLIYYIQLLFHLSFATLLLLFLILFIISGITILAK